jgi:uncharacterized protein with LGFP repeats
MSGSSIDHIVWGQYWPGTENGIYAYWRSLMSSDPPQYLGPPISDEVAVSDGVVQRAFASGAVIQWSADGGAELASDPL